jgi:hypothetical protein
MLDQARERTATFQARLVEAGIPPAMVRAWPDEALPEAPRVDVSLPSFRSGHEKARHGSPREGCFETKSLAADKSSKSRLNNVLFSESLAISARGVAVNTPGSPGSPAVPAG